MTASVPIAGVVPPPNMEAKPAPSSPKLSEQLPKVLPPRRWEAIDDLIQPPANQIASLDFLRSCAILMVLCNHSLETLHETTGQDNWLLKLPFVFGGWLGVDLFFVLSGYLIGRQLWREVVQTNTVAIGRFLIRRGLRIWPLYFAVLVLVASLPSLRPTSGSGWIDACFLSNYCSGCWIPSGWSLCAEEQFYLVAPCLTVLALALLKDLKWLMIPLVGCLVSLPLVRALTYAGPLDHFATFPAVFSRVYFPLHTHCDGLFVGLIMAHLAQSQPIAKRPRWQAWLALLGGAMLIAGSYTFQRTWFLFGGASCFFGGVCWWLLAHPSFGQTFFRGRAFYMLSRLSYGMYLNHMLLMPSLQRFIQSWSLDGYPNLLATLTVLLVVETSAALAAVTYCLIEFPFLRLRDRILEPRHA